MVADRSSQVASIRSGGAALTQAYADEIGADGYAPDADAAIALARRLAR